MPNSTGLYRYGSQGSHYARWKNRGKLIVKKLNSGALRNAKIELNRLKEKHGKIKPAKGSITLVEMAEKYLASIGNLAAPTLTRGKGIVEKLRKWEPAHRSIGTIKPTEMTTWIVEMTKGLSKDSYNKHLSFLQHVFAAAVKDGGLVESPLAGEKTVVPDDGVLIAKTYSHLRNEHSQKMAQRL
jgi:hypothetical protein